MMNDKKDARVISFRRQRDMICYQMIVHLLATKYNKVAN